MNKKNQLETELLNYPLKQKAGCCYEFGCYEFGCYEFEYSKKRQIYLILSKIRKREAPLSFSQ